MPAESPAKYAARVSLEPQIKNLLDACCKDLPQIGHVQQYLLAKLTESTAASGVAVEPDAKAWKPSGKVIINKTQLNTYLDDLRWSPTLAAITEQVLVKRPNNPTAFMAELLAKGDLNADIDAGGEDEAAVKFQALQRGKKAVSWHPQSAPRLSLTRALSCTA